MSNSTTITIPEKELRRFLSTTMKESHRILLRMSPLANHETKIIETSITELSKNVGYNPYVLFSHLTVLREIGCIGMENIPSLNDGIRVKILLD